jgi:non-canonical purine NTP pyrophosphatase (RdgB/HAM1 family)
MEDLTFITGNQHKADYLAKLLGRPLAHQKFDLTEIQSTSLEEVAEHKAKEAYRLAGKPVLVEDVGLSFTALNGLPGPFVKFFVEQPDGLEKLCRMLDGFNDRTARGSCVYGYYDGSHFELISGGIDGIIADHPRGGGGFGWDQIFCPDGYGGRTRAELNEDEYAVVYQIIKPLPQLREFLTSLPNSL